jgi:hypothetical protein
MSIPSNSRPRRPKVEAKDASASTVIEIREFQEARRDPGVRDFLVGAKAYGKKLKREGRIHP